MMIRNDTYSYNMPITLEEHLKRLAQRYIDVQEVQSLWLLLKKRLEQELIHSSNVFVNYSLHDRSHSRSVMQAVERLLGEERICQLSATDTFMLLACIYSHDYGMVQTFNKVYGVLGSSQFEKFLMEKQKDRNSLEREEEKAIDNLMAYIHEKKCSLPLNELYFSIMLVVQLYLRPNHWKGVSDIKSDFEGLFQGHLKKRFIYGQEGIVELCMCHGRSMKELLQLPYCSDGIVGDDFHPRFIASMLRLGDLLDLDNGRFPMWFVNEIARNKNIIPRLSVLHYRKHEAISHLLITPGKIEISAHCYSIQDKAVGKSNWSLEQIQREEAQRQSYDVAGLISDWTESLSDECHQMILHWNEIAQPNFGYPPGKPEVNIFVDGNVYMAKERTFQMRMSQERVMSLLKGTSIYKDRYVGIREMIQNAVDASLLQLWNDLLHNRYIDYGLSKDKVLSDFDLLDLADKRHASILGNYDIRVEVIENRASNQVHIVVKDKGIGIIKEEIQYIADIGSSKEKNVRVRNLMEKMPPWMKPSGVFGIGLQSVFQLTDCIDFYTRQHNLQEQHISVYSYGKNKGKIETKIISEKHSEPYYDNTVPGTNVKIVINEDKFFMEDGKNDGQKKNEFIYFDPEFEEGGKLHMIFQELSEVCNKMISQFPYDYFNIYFKAIIIDKDGNEITGEKQKSGNQKKLEQNQKSEDKVSLCNSFIYPKKGQNIFAEPVQAFDKKRLYDDAYIFKHDKAYFWDKKKCRFYCLTVQPCQVKEKDNRKELILPEKIKDIYNISYKFNRISNTEAIYAQHNRSKRLHAGFLKMDVLIMDDKPMNYMNIDRDRLKDNAVSEEELLSVRDEIVKKWFEYLCKSVKSNTNTNIDTDSENQNKSETGELLFENERGTLISLMLLFYQDVQKDFFEKFLKSHKALLDNIVLCKDEIPILNFWNKEQHFCVKLSLEEQFKSGFQHPVKNKEMQEDKNNGKKQKEYIEIGEENICRFPHRLVHIESISRKDSMLLYQLRIQPYNQGISKINMDEGARLYDYLNAFDMKGNQRDIDYKSIVKKVFKPNEYYEKLSISCFPFTFCKGRNMESELDNCIREYILSPFDEESAKELEKVLKLKEKASDFIDAVMGSEQMKKCVAYILKKNFYDNEKKEEAKEEEEKIKKDYRRFLKDFITLLRKHMHK